MPVNEVIVNGETIISLRSDTVAPEYLQSGITAHDRTGAAIVGTMTPGGGGGEDATAIIERTISGAYENSDVRMVGRTAFQDCSNLTAVSFPACTRIGSYAFEGCTGLTSVSFPACTHMDTEAFYRCNTMTGASFPLCTSVGNSAFQYCIAMSVVSLPVCTTIGTNAFQNCFALTAVNLPACTSVGSSAFLNCSALTVVSLPARSRVFILNYAFRNCSRLVSLYLTGPEVAGLQNSYAFSSTPIGGYSAIAGQYGSIYVPASLLTAYQSSYNWSYFSSRIVGLTDEEIAALEGTA